MEKTISIHQWAIIKRTAQNVNPLVQQKQKLQKKISDLIEEYKSLDTQIQGFEQGIKALCDGLGTEQLVIKTVTPIEGKFDKDGKQVKKTSYEPSSLVAYDAEHNNYIVHIPEPEAPEATKEAEPVQENTVESAVEGVPESTEERVF